MVYQLNKIEYIHKINLSATMEIDLMKDICEEVVTKICAVWFSTVPSLPIYLHKQVHTSLYTYNPAKIYITILTKCLLEWKDCVYYLYICFVGKNIYYIVKYVFKLYKPYAKYVIYFKKANIRVV